jgi:hypothetical protein
MIFSKVIAFARCARDRDECNHLYALGFRLGGLMFEHGQAMPSVRATHSEHWLAAQQGSQDGWLMAQMDAVDDIHDGCAELLRRESA